MRGFKLDDLFYCVDFNNHIIYRRSIIEKSYVAEMTVNSMWENEKLKLIKKDIKFDFITNNIFNHSYEKGDCYFPLFLLNIVKKEERLRIRKNKIKLLKNEI